MIPIQKMLINMFSIQIPSKLDEIGKKFFWSKISLWVKKCHDTNDTNDTNDTFFVSWHNDTFQTLVRKFLKVGSNTLILSVYCRRVCAVGGQPGWRNLTEGDPEQKMSKTGVVWLTTIESLTQINNLENAF